MADFYWKRHDTAPKIICSLTDNLGNVPGGTLTGASVKFIMIATGSNTPKIDAAGTIIDAPSWKVGYAPIGTDTDTAGDFQAEWEITYADGTKQSFPDPGYIAITITADLDNA